MGAGDALGLAKGPFRPCAPERPSSILTTLDSFLSGSTGLEHLECETTLRDATDAASFSSVLLLTLV